MPLHLNDAPCVLRPMTADDLPAYTLMLKRSFNTWYWRHGHGQEFFKCPERDLNIFWDVYCRIQGHCVAAVDPDSGALLGACFYHPREQHVSLGIMAVDPDCFGRRVGTRLAQHIVDFTEKNGYSTLRLVGSACNMDSFSLYNRFGFVPRVVHQDMVVTVPAAGFGQSGPLVERVRDAKAEDVVGIKALELEVSGICREKDYRFFVDNPLGCFHASVFEDGGKISGFAASIKHTVLNMIGPAVARTEVEMLALIHRELERFRGTMVLLVVPMHNRQIVESLYRLGAINVETHLTQVRGKYQPIAGVNLPSFLPESG